MLSCKGTRMPFYALAVLAVGVGLASDAFAVNPTLTDPNLAASTVVTGLSQPICLAFLGPRDFLITERTSGRVKRVNGGVVTATVLDLPVNSNSERGLIGIALHPNFPANPSVYLYWTESSTGADSADVSEVGNPASAFSPGTPPAVRQSGRPLYMGSDHTDPHLCPEPDTASRRPERQEQRRGPCDGHTPRQQQRRPPSLRAGREALHPERRHRPTRLAPEPAQRTVHPGHLRRRVRRTGA